MPAVDNKGPTTWEFCASVSETFSLLSLAQRLGVRVQMTSVRLGPDSAHGPCRQYLADEEDAAIEGYLVEITCEDAPEYAGHIQAEIHSHVRPCLITRSNGPEHQAGW